MDTSIPHNRMNFGMLDPRPGPASGRERVTFPFLGPFLQYVFWVS
jgi:hypothetical protein